MNGYQTGQQGNDFFYNEATGRRESCADKCDIPSQYEFTCAEKCNLYIPKQRVTAPAFEDIEEANDKTYLIIFAVVLIAGIIIVVIGIICRKKLSWLITRLEEIFSRQLSTAQPEEGGERSERVVTQQRLMTTDSSQVEV